ncbi:MAG: ABC-F family ATP-binding cassette domain-containing protein [Polyangiaceae bacterium]|nr:ABC-F family ATP-binding cassette domain-containing protein [Polyangiaceae bacterium]
MSILSAQSLVKAYGAARLLDGASLAIEDRERVGLVGRNGSGKSTLARILAGVEEPDAGTVIRRRDARIALLTQEPSLPATATPRELVLGGLVEWSAATARYQAASEALERGVDDVAAALEEQATAAAAVERLGGWELGHRAEAMMTELGVREPDRPVGTMSGGERRRVALAALLVARPTLAVLDEPTNHLDAETIEWLERYLREEHQGALLLITHDRWVLDRVVGRTLEIESGQVYSYDGGWEDYLFAKAERAELAGRTEANRQNLLRTELVWLARQPKARTGKQKARIQRVEAAAATAPTAPDRGVTLRLQSADLGSTVVELHELCLALGGRELVRDLTLHLTKGERVGVIGRNGTGKTTLLRAVLGELPPAAGRIVRGARVRFTYFEQGRAGLDDAASVLANVAGDGDTVRWGERSVSAYSYLERFSFYRDRIRQPVGSLSGGERARVALAKMLLEPANVVVMDEPTNDLDVATLGAVEELLVEMNATAIVVTHDRYFLDKVATAILAFEGDGRVVRYPGNYATFLTLRAERIARDRQQPAAQPAPRSAPPVVAPATARVDLRKRGLTWHETRELERVEQEIADLEAEAGRRDAELAAPETYATRSAEVPALIAARERAQGRLAVLLARWEELETKRSS